MVPSDNTESFKKAQLQHFTSVSDENNSSSNLLNLIRDYQKLNRYPEDIFEDFLKLQEKYQNLLSNSRLALNDSQKSIIRLYKELKEAKEKSEKLSHALLIEEKKRLQLEKSNKSLQNTVSDLTKERESLEGSIRDSTSQIQYSSNNLRRRDTPITSGPRESEKLLTEAQVSPHIPYDQLVSEEVSELQDLNAKLVSEVRNLKDQVKYASNEVSRTNAKFKQMKHGEELKYKEMYTEFETYRNERTIEINKLKEELLNTSTSTNVRHKKTNLSSRGKQYENELQEYERENSSLRKCIASRDRDLIDFKKRTDTLYDENVSLHSQLKSVTDAYNTTKENMLTQSINYYYTKRLLEKMNRRMEVFTGTSESDKQYEDTIENLNRDLQHASERLFIAEKKLDGYKSIDQQEIKDKYNKSVIEIGLLKTKISDLESQVSNINQERSIAQTKLATAEEQIEVLIATGKASQSSDALSSDAATCDEHLCLLSQARYRMRNLESDIKRYLTIISNHENEIETLDKERAETAIQNQEAIDKLVKKLELKTAEVDTVQIEACKIITNSKKRKGDDEEEEEAKIGFPPTKRVAINKI